MATFQVTDPQTGRTVRLTGDSPPTEAELEQIFGSIQQQQAVADQQPAQQPIVELNQQQPVQQPAQQQGFTAPQALQQGQAAQQQGLGALETAASVVSGAVAEPLAGLAGIGALLPGGRTPTEAIEQTRESLTFQPRTEQGQQNLQSIGETLQPVGEALSGAEKFLGDATFNATGSPALAALATSLPTAALEALGIKGAGRVSRVAEPSSKLIKKTLVEAAPDIEKIKNASRAVYNELDNSGVAIKQPSLKRLERNLDRIARQKGIRERVTPEAFGAIEEIKGDIALGQPLTTSQMDELRTIAKNSSVATDPNKMRVSAAVVDEVDNFLDTLKNSDLERGGQVSASEVGRKYRSARKLWGRAKRAEMIEEAIRIGSGRKAGVEKGIRNELNNLLNRKNSKRFLTKDDMAAIKKVTDGDFKQNFASLLGGMGLKLENSPSMFSSIVGGGGLGALASTVPGLAGVAAPVAIGAVTIGTVAKEVAKRITRNRAKFLQDITGAGNDADRITKAYLRSVPKSKRRVSDLSDLLLDPEINLRDLENVTNETVKDAVKAAEFKREMLKASTALGVGEAAQLSKNSESDNESN